MSMGIGPVILILIIVLILGPIAAAIVFFVLWMKERSKNAVLRNSQEMYQQMQSQMMQFQQKNELQQSIKDDGKPTEYLTK